MVHDGVSFIFAPSCTLCQRALCLYGAQSVRTEPIALKTLKMSQKTACASLHLGEKSVVKCELRCDATAKLTLDDKNETISVSPGPLGGSHHGHPT